jgi:hypothetical protein
MDAAVRTSDLIPRLLVWRDLRLRVLVASGWWTVTASQTMTRIGENVVVTETRVRILSGSEARSKSVTAVEAYETTVK